MKLLQLDNPESGTGPYSETGYVRQSPGMHFFEPIFSKRDIRCPFVVEVLYSAVKAREILNQSKAPECTRELLSFCGTYS